MLSELHLACFMLAANFNWLIFSLLNWFQGHHSWGIVIY